MGVCGGLVLVALTIRLICGKSSLYNYNSGSLSDGIREFIDDFREMPTKDLLLKIAVTIIELLIVIFGLLLILSVMVNDVSNAVSDVMTVQLLP
jgi:hypothetical protein